jgi:hypothetical protein
MAAMGLSRWEYRVNNLESAMIDHHEFENAILWDRISEIALESQALTKCFPFLIGS